MCSWYKKKYCCSSYIHNYPNDSNHEYPGPALVTSETDQGALEQATGRVLRLRIEGPCTEGYCWIRIQN